MEPHLADIDLAGTDLQGFIGQLLQAQLLIGRAAIEVSVADDGRPYWTLWPAEAIRNWRVERIAGRMMLTGLVIADALSQSPDPDDAWQTDTQERLREWVLTPAGVVVRSWLRTDKPDAKWEVVDERQLVRRGEAIPGIPVIPVGAQACQWEVEKPPLLDLVDLNIAEWRNSADYEAALACIKPVYAFFGFPANTEIVLGSNRALVTELPNGSATILQGADPAGLRAALDEKRRMMATLGGRLLEEPQFQETATAVRMRHEGEEATLRTIAVTMAEAVRRALAWHAYWMGLPDDQIAVTPNMDFVVATLTPDQIRAYMELLTAGRISYATFYALLQGGEIARPGVSAEDELAAIERETEQAIGTLQATS